MPQRTCRGVEDCLKNWMRIPNAMFGKAWIKTGHISEEELLQSSDITQEELDNCHLLSDPLMLEDVLGPDNAAAPSVQEMIQGGESKRHRVVWELSGKPGQPATKHLLPAALLYPVEKKLANYLFQKISKRANAPEPKPMCTILLSRRTGKEIGVAMLKKTRCCMLMAGEHWRRTWQPGLPRTQGHFFFAMHCVRFIPLIVPSTLLVYSVWCTILYSYNVWDSLHSCFSI